ncbi:unnamed protein product [Pleuronectes platessa]|uniref:Uncharacterized protein n=1 Tax=Pleuronectes platessa TaxID=8262 RepID=A0A9N7VE89_PLEPL|nr:unnamed protein product [Pleuronectes platessa]
MDAKGNVVQHGHGDVTRTSLTYTDDLTAEQLSLDLWTTCFSPYLLTFSTSLMKREPLKIEDSSDHSSQRGVDESCGRWSQEVTHGTHNPTCRPLPGGKALR